MSQYLYFHLKDCRVRQSTSASTTVFEKYNHDTNTWKMWEESDNNPDSVFKIRPWCNTLGGLTESDSAIRVHAVTEDFFRAVNCDEPVTLIWAHESLLELLLQIPGGIPANSAISVFDSGLIFMRTVHTFSNNIKLVTRNGTVTDLSLSSTRILIFNHTLNTIASAVSKCLISIAVSSKVMVKHVIITSAVFNPYLIKTETEEEFIFFRQLFTGEKREEVHKITFGEDFPEQCFYPIMFYCDISTWARFSLLNSGCEELAERTIWRYFYHRLTGSYEKPANSSYRAKLIAYLSDKAIPPSFVHRYFYRVPTVWIKDDQIFNKTPELGRVSSNPIPNAELNKLWIFE